MIDRPLIFISYRRADLEAEALVIMGELEKRFPDRVFHDAKLEPGDHFPEEIARAIEACHVMLVLIGPNWPFDELKKETDWVRREIRDALGLRKKIIPVLFFGTKLPSEEQQRLYPDDVRPFFREQVDSVDRLARDAARLARVVDGKLPAPVRIGAVVRRSAATVYAAGAALALMAVGLVRLVAPPLPPPPAPDPVWTCEAKATETLAGHDRAKRCGIQGGLGQRTRIEVSRKQGASGALTARPRAGAIPGLFLKIEPLSGDCFSETGSENAKLHYFPNCFKERDGRFRFGFDLISCTATEVSAPRVDLFEGLSLGAANLGEVEEAPLDCKRSR
jgi:hypothetical protein